MLYARIEGSVVATHKHPSYAGYRLWVCQPIDHEGKHAGHPVVAIDPLGAGMHQRVVVSTDGSAARTVVGDPKSPVRHMIVSIVDPSGADT